MAEITKISKGGVVYDIVGSGGDDVTPITTEEIDEIVIEQE